MSTTMPLHWIIFLSTFFTINSSLLGRPYSTLLHDYTINEKGRINLIKETKDSFDRLILVIGKRSNIYYQKQKGTILNRHILLKKGILQHTIPLKGRANGQHFKGLQISFREDFEGAKRLFEFLADHTSIEWSLLSIGINKQSRSFIYTTYSGKLEFFGSIKVHHLLNYPKEIDFLKHYHNHPRAVNDPIGKHAFPSNSDLDFRNKVLKKELSLVEFLIRTDGFYVDYSNPKEWYKNKTEEWL